MSRNQDQSQIQDLDFLRAVKDHQNDLYRIGLPTNEDQILSPGRISPNKVSALLENQQWIFRALSREEIEILIQNARDTYEPFTPIEGIWHPIYQITCVLINHEHSFYHMPNPEEPSSPDSGPDESIPPTGEGGAENDS